MEPSKEAITLRISRLNRQILGKVNGGTYCKISKRTIDREALLDALTVLYDDCNEDPIKKSDELVRAFLDKYRSTLAELRRTRVCISDFDMVQVIGRGHFGEVHMVREKQTGDVYALKVLRKEQARKRAAGAAEDERDVLATAAGPWVPKLQYAFQDSSSLYLVMELCPGGDLAGLLARRSHPLCEADAAFYIAEVTHALKALHGLGYVHRDVKPHNILLDRCGHVKLGDFGSCARLSEGGVGAAPVGTADYVAPELLAAAACAARHSVCLDSCRGITVHNAISACDYWSLGVVAFELVTLRRPFSNGDEDSIAEILSNIQKYECDPEAEPPFEAAPAGPGAAWRALVAGLLRVPPSRRYNYLDTLQHPALAHLSLHTIRDQAPPWVPCVRGPEDASHFAPPPRAPPPPSAAPFRARPPFAGQLPFIGYSYVANDEAEEISGGFNASHNSTAIDLATFKSAEKLAASRLAEIASLQNKLCAAEAASGAGVERALRAAAADHERLRARLQADITALALQNKRLERQLEVEKEERMAVERANHELAMGASERATVGAELRRACAERDAAREALEALERRATDLETECKRALHDAEAARAQHKHYKNILQQVKQLRHRRLTEINVKPIDTMARERALRRETLSGGEARESAAVAAAAAEARAAAEAGAAEERAGRARAERRLQHADAEAAALRADLDDARKELARAQESLHEKKRDNDTVSEQLKQIQLQLTQERVRTSTLTARVQELQREVEEARCRESAVEEQCVRTEARLKERLEAADSKATAALQDDARHREKVNTLEQLVRQLEREVSALETRRCGECAARGEAGGAAAAHSDTESVTDEPHAHAQAQLALLKEQLERAEAQMQARTEEMAVLRQEARAANLARWRKEREFNELSVEAKSSAREVKRLEERLAAVQEARKTNDLKVISLQKELDALKPLHEQVVAEANKVKQRQEKLLKAHETAQAEVDRSRNDIRKLKSELQYSEKRRLHAEQQEEVSSRERAQLRDELVELRASKNALAQNNKALQEACSLLEEQLTDLEKLSDINEVKNNDLESEVSRMRAEVSSLHTRLSAAERAASERGAAASGAELRCDSALEQARHAHCQLQLLKERVEVREARVAALEARLASAEEERAAAGGAASAAARRARDLLEECAALRTQAHHHQARAEHLQRQLQEKQEELSEAREAAEAAAAWWRTRETKADATLRQQAKLIDFLQAKVEEAGRKKCSLSHKLFGRSGRRTVASPPLRRANRSLREEIEQLRSQLASLKAGESGFPPTPRKEKKPVNTARSIDMPDSAQDPQESMLQIVWSDGSRESMTAREVNGALELRGAGEGDGDGERRKLRAVLLTPQANFLPQNEAGRAFTVQVENSSKGGEAGVVCATASARADWVSRLRARAYWPVTLATRSMPPATALALHHDAVAIGCPNGLYSLRGKVELSWSEGVRETREVSGAGVRCLCMAGARALLAAGGALALAQLPALRSALRRAPALAPALALTPLALPGDSEPHVITAVRGEAGEGLCAAVGAGRRVFLVRSSGGEVRVARSLTVDRAPPALLLVRRALYIAGERPLRVLLPAGTLEPFALADPTVAAAAAKHSPPRAILLVNEEPLEILLCYTECGVFVNGNGKRTRNEDPKWSTTVESWEYVTPFLYLVGDDRVTIVYLTDDAYRAPPCTCDSTSIASTASECYMPETYDLKIKEPALLGVTPTGIIIRSKVGGEYSVSVVEGLAAFRSIGASVESLATASDPKGSSTDLAHSTTDLSTHDDSQDSVEVTTGFLADIRKRAKQLRDKNQKEMTADDVIKEILTTEVGLKRPSASRRSPATISEFDSDTESEDRVEITTTADVCAEMFTRQKLLTG